MAQRLATEYVKTCLHLSEVELFHFIQLFAVNKVNLEVKVYENGNQEVVYQDDSDQEIIFTFEKKNDRYVSQGSCKLSSPRLVNVMRKAVSSFKGDAIVHRKYASYTMIYYYEKGTVVKIVEVSQAQEKLIYIYKNSVGLLTEKFRLQTIEQEIVSIKSQINVLLEQRYQSPDVEIHELLDQQLLQHAHRLFVLEA